MVQPSASVESSVESGTDSFGSKVRSAVIWRSGSQIAAQMIAWASTFLVIRILDPHDYGLFAMTQVIMALMAMLNGYGLASAIIQQPAVTPRQIRQLFGLLIVVNVTIAAIQFAGASLIADYYRQPIVGDMLKVQCLLYLATPFIALPYALLARAMDFRKQAKANMVSAFAGAVAALGGALAGLEMWTLVLAPMVLFWTRAIMMTWFARSLVWPSFDFRGAGHVMRFGGVMAVGQLFWFLQSQSDIFIAGRHFDPHDLGIYSTGVFLTQIFVSKFVPPLNEVAFSAYARIQHDRAAFARAFTKAVGIVMVVALPFYFGLVAVSEPLVLTVLGPKWVETVPIVHLLALAMPFMTLQVLYSPACDASGRPGIGVISGACGAAILATSFLVGVHWGAMGLAAAWLAAYPVYLAVGTYLALPVIGARVRDVADAIAPPLLAALAMAIIVGLVDGLIFAWAPLPRLTVLVAVGGAVYAGWLTVFSRALVRDLIALVFKRQLGATV